MWQRSWVQIPYSPEFFSGLIFTTAEVVFITAKIALYSRLYPQFKYMTFIYSQSFREFIIEKRSF